MRQLILVDVVQFPQQVHEAALVLPRPLQQHMLVRPPEVVDQHPLERLGEERMERFPAAALVDHVIAVPRVAEAPQPVRVAVHSPSGLVGVQGRRVPRFPPDLLVPRQERLGRPPPQVGQAAGGDLGLQRGEPHISGLIDGQAKTVVEDRGERDDAIADGRARQRRRHARLDMLATARAPMPRDHVLDRLHTRVLGHVLDHAAAALPRGQHRPAALRAGLELLDFLGTVDPGRRPAMALVPVACPGLLAPAAPAAGPLGCGRLEVRRDRAAGCVRTGCVRIGCDRPAQLRDTGAGREHHRSGRVGTERHRPHRKCFGQHAAQRGIDDRSEFSLKRGIRAHLPGVPPPMSKRKSGCVRVERLQVSEELRFF